MFKKHWGPIKHKDVDKEKKHFTPVIPADENQLNYLKRFGVDFEIPQIDILGSKLFPQDPTYVLMLVHYNCPGGDKEDEGVD